MENECEALPGVAYPGVRDNRSTLNTKTGYDDDDVTTTSIILSLKKMANPGSSKNGRYNGERGFLEPETGHTHLRLALVKFFTKGQKFLQLSLAESSG